MLTIGALLPFTSSLVSFLFAGAIFKRYLSRTGHHHLLVWGLGTVFYGIGGASEAFTATFGFTPLVLKVWYLFGAILVAAWLGQGTVFLLARARWVRLTTIVLLVASLFAVFVVATAQVDPNYQATGELTGKAFATGWVRMLTPFFNIYGTVTLVGGALYSSWLFWRKRVLPNRMIGNILIATGAIFPAFGGVLSRFGLPGLYVSEFIGVVLMFIGFLQATATVVQPARPATSVGD